MTADIAVPPAPPVESGSDLRDALVRAVRMEAAGVVSIEFSDAQGALLPSWTPGAHVDLILPSGLVRQYSLCGDPEDRFSYRIAVLREDDGRGGSAEIHDSPLVGKTLQMRGPRNHFKLEDHDDYVFVAGGIGITPILAMVRRVAAQGRTFKLIYGGRTRTSMAFVDELVALAGDRMTIVPQDQAGHIDLAGMTRNAASGSAVYCCGPEPLLTAIEQACSEAESIGPLHVERFGAAGGSAAPVADGAQSGFEVELRRTGCVLQVGPDDVLIDVVREKCPQVMSSCEEGFCGTCETAVLEGEPEHRDTILSEKDRVAGKTMMICVGRSKSPRLVLDL